MTRNNHNRIFVIARILFVIVFGITGAGSKNSKSNNDNGNNGNGNQEPTVIAEAIPNTGYVTTGGVLYTEITTTTAQQTTTEQILTTTEPTVIAEAIPNTGYVTTGGVLHTEITTTTAEQTATEQVIMTETTVATTQIGMAIPFDGFITTTALPFTENNPTTNAEQTTTQTVVTENTPAPTTQIALVVPTGGFMTTDFAPNTEPPTTNTEPPTTNTEQTVTEPAVTVNTPAPTTQIALVVPTGGFVTTDAESKTEPSTTNTEQTVTEPVVTENTPAPTTQIALVVPTGGFVTTDAEPKTEPPTTKTDQTVTEPVVTENTPAPTTQIALVVPTGGFVTTDAEPKTEPPATNTEQTVTEPVVTENTPAPTTQIALVVPTGGFVTTDAEPKTEPPTTNTEQTVTEPVVTENTPAPTTQIALVVPTGGFVTTDAEPKTEPPTTNTEQTVTEPVVTENTPAPTTQIALVVPTGGFVTTDAEPKTEPPATNTEQTVTEPVVTENTPAPTTQIALVVPTGGFITTTTTAKPHTEIPDTNVDGIESPQEPVTEVFTTVKMAHDIPGDDFYTTKRIKIPTTVTEDNVKEKPEPTSKPLGAIAYKTFKTTDDANEIFKPTTTPQTLGAIAYTTFMTTDALPTVNLPEINGETLLTGTNNDDTIDTVDGPVIFNPPATPALMIAETNHHTTPALMIAGTEVAGTEAPNFGLFQLDGSALLTSTSVQGPTSTPGLQTATSTSASIQSNASGLSAQSGLQIQHLGNLLDYLLNDYDKRIRPRRDQSRRVTIFSDFVTQSIIEFDTQLQSFSVMGYFKMDWRDDLLRWTPADYGDTETLRIPAKSVWLPKLLVNKGQDGHGLVGDRNTDIVLINYKGYVRWFPEGIYSVVCQVTIKFYPFDVQNCTFSYYIADEDNSTINLKDYGEVDLTEYIENAEWKLVDLAVDRKAIGAVYFINFHYKVERRGGFAMFTLIVPVLMLSMMGGSTFLIPIESGEKCSFSVTIFLSYGIFETMVIDTLPPNSLDVSYFIIYLTSMLIVSTLLTFYTILQAKIFDLVGDRQFGLIRCGNSAGPDMTWGKFLQKLDTFVFMAFLVFVVGCTSTFLTVMSTKFDFL